MATPKSVEEIYVIHPLMRFSVYTHMQVETVNLLARSIVADMDEQDERKSTDSVKFNQTYGSFWLWVLGAYEIIRTMKQANDCFSARVQSELQTLNTNLKSLRVPFAKQELSNHGDVVSAELSVSEITNQPFDMVYTIKNVNYSARQVLSGVLEFFESISADDVLKDLRLSVVD